MHQTPLHLGSEHEGCDQFRLESIKKAEADFERKAVLGISKAGHTGSRQALAWSLERRYPDRFDRKDRIDAWGLPGGLVLHDGAHVCVA